MDQPSTSNKLPGSSSSVKNKTNSKSKKETSSSSSLPQRQVGSEVQQEVMLSWGDYLNERKDVQWICGVEYFNHAPFGTEKWQNFAKHGMVVEVPNGKDPSTYWPATVFGFAGYNALVEYVRIDEKTSGRPQMCWIPFCSKVPKPLGYCLTNDILLKPVSEIDQKDPEFLKKTFTKLAAKKLPTVKPDHWEHCLEELKLTSSRFKLNEVVEALDKHDCSRNRIGTISMMLGNRIHVQYVGLEDDDEGFWFCQQSEHVHKIGWSHAVGAELVGASPNLAYPLPSSSEFQVVPAGVKVVKNAMFEMRHPVHLHEICVAYVVEPLRNGYFLAGTDWTRKNETVEIVMHITSDYILPINFCRKHGIDLVIPKKDGKEIMKFSWRKYLADVECTAMDLSAIKKEEAKFTKGCKMEAVDLKEPTYLGPVTVTAVCGHLLQIHFDGYPRTEEDSFQWVSAQSSDIYPACYSQFIGHKLGNKPDRPNPADLCYFTDPEPSTSTSSKR
ncbi:unnamed protein product [Orchesella dallaii]|uniref:Uncharacterized protein n=1 Tax=Orchesella dallaii TaxID=48710 RepID=A0ABP1RXR4_9HEXA